MMLHKHSLLIVTSFKRRRFSHNASYVLQYNATAIPDMLCEVIGSKTNQKRSGQIGSLSEMS
jgi:hypothetical protein